jgi:dolichol-phosphate mannosyltransferase
VFGFSYLLLDGIIYLGFILVGLSFLFIVLYLFQFLLYGNPIKGAVTILVSIVFFGGVNLLGLSIIGKYIQVIVEETKHRPTYIVEDSTKNNFT